MKREIEGRITRLEEEARLRGGTDEQWEKLRYMFSDEPIPPELQETKIPITMLRTLMNQDEDSDTYEPEQNDDE